MAIANALAVGLPLVRPVRASTSFVADRYGRVLGSQRFDGSGDSVLVVAVPAARVPTLYAKTGEVIPVLALLFCAFVLAKAFIRPREHAR